MPSLSLDVLRDAWRLWRTGSRLRAMISPHLTPGLYIRTGYKGVVWRRWRSPIPDLVRATKLPPKSRKTRRVRVMRWLVNNVVKGPPLFVVWSRTSGPPLTTPASVAIRGAYGDSFILLDDDRSRVLRVATDEQFSREYVDLRERLSRHVPVPRFQAAEGGRALTEEYIRGVPASSLDIGAQHEATTALMSDFVALATAEGTGSSAPIAAEVLAAVERADLPRSLREVFPAAWLESRSGQWPLVPCHGDAHFKNVVVTDRGPVMIDVDPGFLGMGPFWFDAMSLLVSVPPPLRKRLLGDPLTHVLIDELWLAATGSRRHGVTDAQLLAAACVLRALTLAKRDRSEGLDIATFEERVRRVWARRQDPSASGS